MNYAVESSAGLYLHIPFCERKCPYCDFYSVLIDNNNSSKYIDAVISESRKASDTVYGDFAYDTIYIGGGTPSLLNPEQIDKILENLLSSFDIGNNAEITIECNPSSLTGEKIEGYQKAGINRISLGVQSLNEIDLKTLGRMHTRDNAISSYRILRDFGIENISVDLIYGIPGQTISGWLSDLVAVIDMGPEHISAYNLIIESGTEFGKLYEQGLLNLHSDEDQSQMYEILNEQLKNAGYRRYEISNFSKPGYECRHNLKYWTGMPYLGLGPSAVSFDGEIRRKNMADIDYYIGSAERNEDIPSEKEVIDRETAIRESIISGLRLTRGVSLKTLKDRFDYDILEEKRQSIDTLLNERLIDVEDDYVRLTEKALFISDSVMVKLI